MSEHGHLDVEALEAELRALRAPDEDAAAERGRRLALAAFADREAVDGRRRLPGSRRLLGAALGAIAVAAFALTPAGASVREWIGDAIDDRDARAPAPLEIPGPGSVLTVGGAGTWVANGDGSARRLGGWDVAGYSPRGINVVVGAGRELAAVGAADGELRWRLTAPGRISDPAWAPTSGGIRIAYRSGSDLRIVEGDGSGDMRLDAAVSPVAPSWRPVVAGEPARDVLAWVNGAGRVEIADVASTSAPTEFAARGRIAAIAWVGGERLAVATERELALYSAVGSREIAFPLPPGARIAELAPSPDGERLAYSRVVAGAGSVRGELVLARVEPGEQRQSVLFSGPGTIDGVAFAPDGSRIGFGWPAADAWLFARPAQRTKQIETIEAAPEITGRFSQRPSPAGSAPAGFPAFVAWCC